jgi:hypothetical protein
MDDRSPKSPFEHQQASVLRIEQSKSKYEKETIGKQTQISPYRIRNGA